jgi:hypothetical protein
LAGCNCATTPAGLALSPSIFPEDWAAKEDDVTMPGQYSFAHVDYWDLDNPESHAVHWVWRFQDIAKAEEKLKQFAEMTDSSQPITTTSNYSSAIASEFVLRCFQDDGNSLPDQNVSCMVTARYKEYLSVFSTGVGEPNGLPRQEFERILSLIDQSFEKLLSPPCR